MHYTREEQAAAKKVRDARLAREKLEAAARKAAERALKILIKGHGPEQILRWARAAREAEVGPIPHREAAE